MSDTCALFILAEVTDDPLGGTLVDVSHGLRTVLQTAGLDVRLLDVRVVPPAASDASAFSAFVVQHVVPTPRPQRWRAFAGLAAVLLEARADERRRLCRDRAAYEAACRITTDELERHAVPGSWQILQPGEVTPIRPHYPERSA